MVKAKAKLKVKKALLSVSDKTGIADFAKQLSALGVDIVSTGGTAALLKDAGVEATDVSDVTGFPEMMDGRVKTLHPRIHGAFLAKRNNHSHMEEIKQHDIDLIDMVVVNLYPFEATIAKDDVSLDEAVENIDIGGPAMIRASAKNFEDVAVVTNPADYDSIIAELKESGEVSETTRRSLAVKAFRKTADYDAAIDKYMSRVLINEDIERMSFHSGKTLRYGENWHQSAKFYTNDIDGPSLAKARQLHGKELSYNNYVDMDNASNTVRELGDAIAVSIVKHNNPCGLATGKTLRAAIEAAWDCDPVSAFGSIICTNQKFTLEAAEYLKGRFVEVILAPAYDDDALEYLKNKSKDLRILVMDELNSPIESPYVYKHVLGGLLEQSRNVGLFEKWDVVTEKEFADNKKGLAEFATVACKCTKSNSISIGYEYEDGCYMALAMGAGQPNRVDSVKKLAATKARENLAMMYEQGKGTGSSLDEYITSVMSECVMVSDAFFPFDDSIVASAENGIYYVVSPGGSIRDGEVIETANRLGVSLVFTGMRHFLH